MRRSTLLTLWLLTALLPGCMMRDLNRNLRMLGEYAVLRGTVAADPESKTPVIVVLYSGEGEPVPADDFLLARPGSFFFLVRPGSYRLAAFQDTQDDQVYDTSEDHAILLNGGKPIEAVAGEQLDDLNLDFRSDPRVALPFAFADRSGIKGVKALPDGHVGEVTTITDARFSENNAQMGLWRPVQFLFDVGAGVYFLEAYDPDKTPVLFVHGAVGNPSNFRELISHLDRTKYQPWLFYYPTAARLDNAAQALGRWIQALWVQYRFEKMAVVAHSMGGLVSREFINNVGAAVGVELFVTISTPWQGHYAAQLGVEQAPVVAPSWYDMAPGSPFLEQVLVPPLPEDSRYYLLFSYGGRSWFNGEANDEAVTVASQLDFRAQLAAKRVYGFNTTHRMILDNTEVSALLADFLAGVEP